MEFLVLGVGVVFIVVAIAVFKVHPFLALILAGFLVGILSPVPLDLKEELATARSGLERRFERGEISEPEFLKAKQGLAREIRLARETEPQRPGRQAVQALEFTTREFGSTAASIGIVIALAAIIGQCLMISGAADRIVRALLRFLGEKRAPAALMGSGYFLSIPVFFDTVFFLLIPLARALRIRTGKGLVSYVLAISAGGIVTHSLVPPTPGPLIMVENFEPFGLTLAPAIGIGFLLGLIPALAALFSARQIDRRLDIPLRDAVGSSEGQLQEIVHRKDPELPSLLLSILPVILPVLLITGHAVLSALQNEQLVSAPDWVTGWSAFLGNKNMALLVAAALAILLLAHQTRMTLTQIRETLEPAIMSAGVIILITSAGGAFGKMLSRCGVSEALQNTTGEDYFGGVGLLVLAWTLSSVMKIAQGSGTVAMITASAMIVSLLGDTYDVPYHPIYLFAAIGFGSVVISWMNDSAFWVVCKMSGFTEKETLATWTPLLAVIGIVGLVEVVILSVALPLL
jgi:GntP family gluconate:H+ symporter